MTDCCSEDYSGERGFSSCGQEGTRIKAVSGNVSSQCGIAGNVTSGRTIASGKVLAQNATPGWNVASGRECGVGGAHTLPQEGEN